MGKYRSMLEGKVWQPEGNVAGLNFTLFLVAQTIIIKQNENSNTAHCHIQTPQHSNKQVNTSFAEHTLPVPQIPSCSRATPFNWLAIPHKHPKHLVPFQFL